MYAPRLQFGRFSVSLVPALQVLESQSDSVPEHNVPPGKLTLTLIVPLKPQLLKLVREAAKKLKLVPDYGTCDNRKIHTEIPGLCPAMMIMYRYVCSERKTL